ncbi:sigma-54-dependent Fis family transcriptional regulator [Amaricoccus solimangrovi]|nr:helix-turn-helix domain-containing protein [Amaricoccus solimangrovi]
MSQEVLALARTAPGAVDPGMADTISASWKACLGRGMDPHASPERTSLSAQDFLLRKQMVERVLLLARPEMELLSSQIAGSNNLIAFGDPTGTLIDVIADTECAASEVRAVITPGSVWDETIRGTNALGLSAKHKKLVTVIGSEHFFRENSGIGCTAAPIFDSANNILGVLNVTSPLLDRQYYCATLVNIAVNNISNRLFVEDHRNDLIILCHSRREYLDTQSAGMLAFDADGRLTGRNMMAQRLLGALPKRDEVHFSDLFLQDFGGAMDQIGLGDTVVLRDRTNSAIAVKLRLTRGRYLQLPPRTGEAIIGVDAVRVPRRTDREPEGFGQPEDELLRQRARMSVDALRLGMPVRVLGLSGHGLSRVAETIHALSGLNPRRVVVDCGAIVETHLSSTLKARVHGSGAAVAGEFLDLAEPSTLIIDGIEKVGSRSKSILETLADQVREMNGARDAGDERMWALIAIENRKPGAEEILCPNLAHESMNDIWGYTCEVMPLAARADFDRIAVRMLADIAPGIRLSDDAAERMRGLGGRLTFYLLRRLLFQLTRVPDAQAIRDEDVLRLLPWITSRIEPCAHCAGHPVKTLKCLEIQKAVAECGGNISIAARRLNMSRTTVYKHIGPGPEP